MSQSFWWSFQDTCCLTFHTSTMEKPRVFAAFQTKNFATDPKNQQTTREKHGICDTFAKMLPINKNKKHWKTKTPKRRVVDEDLAKHRDFVLSTKKPPKHKRHTPRGGRSTCYIVVVAVAVAVVVFVVVVVVVVVVVGCCCCCCCRSGAFWWQRQRRRLWQWQRQYRM